MKLPTTLLFNLVSFIALSQTCAPNNITTNPAAPVNAQRPSKLNTWDWTATDFTLNSNTIYNGNNSIRSPFFDTDNSIIDIFYDPIPGPKDFLPGTDGWELIKKDFGNDGFGPVNNPYFVLYNKYRGLLRIFVARGDQAFFNGASLKLQFLDDSPMQTSIFDFANELKAIDAPFVRQEILSSSSEILNGYEEWFYADFPLSYDPCTCIFASKMKLDIHLSSTSKLSLEGHTEGSLVSQGEPSADQQAKGSFSIGDAATVAKKVHETYDDITTWSADYLAKPAAKATAIGLLKGEIKKSNFLKAGLSALPWIGDALDLADFFFGGGRKVAAPQLVTVSPMAISMTSRYSGSIYTDYPYGSTTFRTPGSNVAGSPPGVPAAPDSEYAYYNEVLGVLNLLRTPVVMQKISYTLTNNVVTATTYSYRLQNEIQYVLNPASGLVVQEIRAALVTGTDQSQPTFAQGSFQYYSGKNATTGLDENRTSFVDLGCIRQNIFTIKSDEFAVPIQAEPSGPMRIKIMANLRRIDATADTQNILFVATFPVTLISSTNLGTTTTCTTPLRLPETAATVQSFCSQNIAYTQSSRFARIRGRGYEDLVKDLGASEKRIATVNKENDLVSVFPNPAGETVNFKYKVAVKAMVNIEIIDVLGKASGIVINSTSHDVGEYSIDYKHGLSKGIYLVSIRIGNNKQTVKLIIQ